MRAIKERLMAMPAHVMMLALSCTLSISSANIQAGEIVIATVAPFSGPLAENGEGNYVGAKAYIDSVNARGGVNGNKIRLVREDDRYIASETLRLVELVAKRDNPVAFINLIGSPNVSLLLKSKTFENLMIPAIGVTPGSELLTNPGSKLIFHVQASDRAQLEKILDQQRTIGSTRIAVVYQDIPFGHAGLAFIESRLAQKGMQIVAKAPMASGQLDAKAVANLLREARPQSLVLVLSPYSAAAFVREIRAAGDATPIYSMSYTPPATLIDKAGVAASVGIALSQVVPNSGSATTGIVREYQAVHDQYAPKGAQYSSYSLVGFIAAKVTIEGLKRLGPNPTPARLATTVNGIRDLNLGGYVVDFSAGDRIGSRYVTIGVIGTNGKLIY